MATPIIVGVGAITAVLVGRQLFRSGIIGGKRAAEEWENGVFKAKMDRKEAVAILGLKCAYLSPCNACLNANMVYTWTEMAQG